jgi:hypothetical protein
LLCGLLAEFDLFLVSFRHGELSQSATRQLGEAFASKIKSIFVRLLSLIRRHVIQIVWIILNG